MFEFHIDNRGGELNHKMKTILVTGPGSALVQQQTRNRNTKCAIATRKMAAKRLKSEMTYRGSREVRSSSGTVACRWGILIKKNVAYRWGTLISLLFLLPSTISQTITQGKFSSFLICC